MTTQDTPPPLWTLALQAAASLIGDSHRVSPMSAAKTSTESFHSGDPNSPVHEVLTALRAIASLVRSFGVVTAAQPRTAGIPIRSKRMAGQPWSLAQEDVLIARSEEGMTIQEVAIMLERSDGAIRSRLRMINYPPHGRPVDRA